MVEILNCNTGNYQCGGKCQPNTNKCYNYADRLMASKINLVVSSLNKILSETKSIGQTNSTNIKLTEDKRNRILSLANQLIKIKEESKNFFLTSDLVSVLRVADEINREFFGEDVYNKSSKIVDKIGENYKGILKAEKEVTETDKIVSGELDKLGFRPFQLLLFDKIVERGLTYDLIKKEYKKDYFPKIGSINKEINSLKDKKKSLKRGDPEINNINNKIKELESDRAKVWSNDSLAYSIMSFFKVDLKSENPKFDRDMSQEKIDKAIELSFNKKNTEKKLIVARDNFNNNLDNQLKERYNLVNNYGISESNGESLKREKETINPILLDRGLPMGSNNNPVEVKLQEMVDSRVPLMAVGPEAFSDIVEDEIFKTAFDYVDSPIGIASNLTKDEFQKYLELRVKVASERFNVPIDASNEERQNYGFMGNDIDLDILYNDHDNGGIKPYGNIIFQFKTDVKDDLTVTIDDSLGLGDIAARKASPANSVSIESLPIPAYENQESINLDARNLSELYNKDIYYQDSSKDDDDDDDLDMESSSETKKLRKPRYIEWQSIRRLGLNDVKGVFIPINELANIPQHILDKLEQMGIKITVVGAK
jgi:hypothetical protein